MKKIVFGLGMMVWAITAGAQGSKNVRAEEGSLFNSSLNSRFAQGTGVGNGSDGAVQANRDRILDRMGGRMRDRGASPDRLSMWCDNASTILREELGRARVALYNEARTQAATILNDALWAVDYSMDVDPNLGGPLTKRWVHRGLIVSNALNQYVRNSDPLELTAKLNFLFSYVEFIIRNEPVLDREVYIPYRYTYNGCQNCDNFDYAKFEERFVRFAREQLEFVANTLTEISTNPYGERMVYPKGDSKVFLKVSELEAGFIAEDLSFNLSAPRNSCVISELRYMQNTLRDYNDSGDRTSYPNEIVAVGATRMNLDRVINALETRNCHQARRY